jgi:hypothetical protein
VAAPLAVCAGLKLPHALLGAQLQSTPALAESLDTEAVIVAVALTARVVGGAWVKPMVTVVEWGVEPDPEPQPDITTAKMRNKIPPNHFGQPFAHTFPTISSK